MNGSGVVVIGGVLSRRFRVWQHRPSEGEDTITFNFICFACFHRRTSLLGVDLDVDDV